MPLNTQERIQLAQAMNIIAQEYASQNKNILKSREDFKQDVFDFEAIMIEMFEEKAKIKDNVDALAKSKGDEI